MEVPDHKFELTKVVGAWAGVGGAKAVEHYHDPITILVGFSLTDWAALLAIVYSVMQISLLFPRWFKTFKRWLLGFFL